MATKAEQINAASAALDLFTSRCGRTRDELHDVPELIVALRHWAVHSNLNWADVVDAANLKFETGA